MINNYSTIISKLIKNDEEMSGFFQNYERLSKESKHLLSGAANYYEEVESYDYKFEELLKEFASEKNLGTTKKEIFKNVEKITILYLKEKEIFMYESKKILIQMENQMNDLYGIFKKPTDEEKEKIKELLIKYLEIIDRGIDSILLVCLIRYSFDNMYTSSAYDILLKKHKFNQELNILGNLSKNMDLKIFVATISEMF